MFKDPIEYLKHIADECSYIISVTTYLADVGVLHQHQ